MTLHRETVPRRIEPAHDSGPTPESVPNDEGGPLGTVDPVNPLVPGAAPHPPSGLATVTVVVGFGGLVASLVVLARIHRRHGLIHDPGQQNRCPSERE
jgi:hypothetical protein